MEQAVAVSQIGFPDAANLRQRGGAYSEPSNLNATSLRIDHSFNNRVTLFGRYNHAPSTSNHRDFAVLDDTTVNPDTATVGPHLSW